MNLLSLVIVTLSTVDIWPNKKIHIPELKAASSDLKLKICVIIDFHEFHIFYMKQILHYDDHFL